MSTTSVKRQNSEDASDARGKRAKEDKKVDIAALMEQTKRQIEERKKALMEQQAKAAAASATSTGVARPSLPLPLPLPTPGMNEAHGLLRPPLPPPNAATATSSSINIAAMQASVQARLEALRSKQAGGAAATIPMSGLHAASGVPHAKPQPLVLTAEGRIVDQEGKEVKLGQVRELKVNQRIQEKGKGAEGPKKGAVGGKESKDLLMADEEDEAQEAASNPYFDPRLVTGTARQQRRALHFREHGYYQDLAERKRAKERLEALQQEIAAAAKKTGISSATKLALAVPRLEGESDNRVPDIEWWDQELIPSATSYDAALSSDKLAERDKTVTHLIQHPIPFEPPVDPNRNVVIPIMLTKQERKKLRTQRRKQEEKEKQEKIRLGLMEPAAPKVRIANLMRVLGMEAVQDPTKVEAIVRAQMAMRQEKHERENASRMLTPAQRQQKRIQKIKKDTRNEVLACVFRIHDLSDQRKRFKVEMNARQLMLSGVGLIHPDITVVVVEGGPRGLRYFKKLMLQRIKWAGEEEEEEEEDESESESEEETAGGPGVAKKGELKKAKGRIDDQGKRTNTCSLVWGGTIAERSFEGFELKTCRTEIQAREILAKHKVPQYWDLALSQSILENSQD